MTREIANAASKDAADRSMRTAGRTHWNEDDYNVAVDEFNRLWPLEKDYPWMTPEQVAEIKNALR